MEFERRNNVEVYLHFIWVTDQRLPLLTADIEADVYRCIGAECVRLQCKVLAIGGMPDHVHLAVALPTTITLAKLMQQVKGSSSHLIANMLRPDEYFAWREGYSVFSFSRTHLEAVLKYIGSQKAHHANNQLWPLVEEL